MRWGIGLLALLLINSLYLATTRTYGLLFISQVFVHLGLMLPAAWLWASLSRSLGTSNSTPAWLRLVLMATAATAVLSGLGILLAGNDYGTRPVVSLYLATVILASWAGIVVLLRQQYADRTPAWIAPALLALLILPASRPLWPTPVEDQIINPILAGATMAEESQGGADGPFYPSAVATSDGKPIPSHFFLESQTCGEAGCHPDVTEQWASSMHHFSSFNNQWYRKSIEYMQETVGLEAPKWCAGCHDPALLLTEQFEQPVADFIDLPEAKAGLGCMACHSVTSVQNTMGNGGYVMDYPELHDLATSDNRAVKEVHDFLVKIAPQPHAQAFLKPLHTEQASEFCSSCHKVHLDVDVNNYRWVRGFNSYDNWQASGVSGEGARSFYYPPEPMGCTDCHMPLVRSDDAGNKDGYIKSHRFAAANTAVPTANMDTVQVEAVRQFLMANQVRVDIFAVSEPGELQNTPFGSGTSSSSMGSLSSTFAVGEESGMQLGGGGLTREATAVLAPLDDGAAVLVPGTSVRLDVVVRTLGVGHFFPSGTVDAQEVWLELKAEDTKGQLLMWSGFVEPDPNDPSKNGPVDPSAHFYRSRMVDAGGNLIDKRNAFMSRSVVYVNLIPPGAADVAHYRLNVPEDVGPEVTVTAQLHYRKFDWQHTQFAYAGEMVDTGNPDDVSVHHDSRPVAFTADLSQVSGAMKAIPDVPIVTMAKDELRLTVAEAPIPPPAPKPNDEAARMRWNDYGIGLLLEGDLKGAEHAFQRAVEVQPSYTDGWVNLARVYLREGNVEEAFEVLAEAERVEPGFHKTRYFRGLYYKALGEYDSSLVDLKAVAELYPKDRVVLNDIGRVHYLNAEPEAAIPYFERALAIDPEDLMAHYNLMFCYRAVGNEERSKAHEIRYLRYKEDESARAIAQSYRRENPHDNNMSQPIFEHFSAYPPLD